MCRNQNPVARIFLTHRSKTITKNGDQGYYARSCHQEKAKISKSLENELKGQIASKIQIRPDYYIQTDICSRIINQKKT